MADRASEIAFFREGLSHYPDARETVDYFEKSVEESISRAFDAKTQWKTFQPTYEAALRIKKTKFIGQLDPHVSVYIGGTLPSQNGSQVKVWVYLGLWWNPQYCPSMSSVAYCHCARERGTSIQLPDLPNRDKRLSFGPLNRKNKLCLLLNANSDFDPDDAFPLLLDALDDALSAIDAGIGIPEGPE